MFKWVWAVIWMIYLSVSVMHIAKSIDKLNARLEVIEKRDLSKYVLTCKLRDSQNRKVCGYIEVK